MRKIISILFLAFFATSGAMADEYGLRLNPRSPGSPSLVLNSGEPVRSREILELSFDVRSTADEPYGCICRLVGDRGYVIDLINSVSRDHRWIPLLIAGGKSLELKSEIRWGEWMRVSLQVDTKNGSVTLNYGGELVSMDVPVIKGSNSFRISFGQCPFEKFDVGIVASFDIRDIRLSSGHKIYAEWPLRMHSGNSSPDLSGHRTALSTDPVWLADELIKPKPLLHLGCGKGTCIAFDGNRNFLIMDDPAQIVTFDAVALTLDSLLVTDGTPPANATNQAIFTGESLLSYNLLGNTYATFNPGQGKWSGGKSVNENDYYTNYTATWDPERQKLYCFGGYGFFHLYNDLRICDPAHPDSLRVVSLTGISPRCFPSSALLDGQIYIFGGKGTKSGNQELAQEYNYDLYSFNPGNGDLTSIWTLPLQPEERYVPGENMVWESSEGCFYVVLIPDEKDFVVARVYRDKPVGTFHSSEPLLNTIYEMTKRTFCNNFHSIVTDCPTREKNGWTADGYLAVDISLLNFDNYRFYEKWCDDLADNLRDDGRISGIIPDSHWGYMDWIGPVWDAAMFIIPEKMYEYTGDTRQIEKLWPVWERYLDYLKTRETEDGVVTYGIGDWVWYKVPTPTEFTSPLYYYYDYKTMARFASITGREASPYAAKAEQIKTYLNDKWFDPEKDIYANGSQCAQGIALYMGIVPEGHEQAVADNLARMIEDNDGMLEFGSMGSRCVLQVLTDYGHVQTAFNMATKRTCPSWGWWVEQGFTTLAETWALSPEFKDASLDHVFLGGCSNWYVTHLAGIRYNFDGLTIKPHFPEGLDEVSASYESIYGTIRSHWKRLPDGSIDLKVEVPPGLAYSSQNLFPGK